MSQASDLGIVGNIARGQFRARVNAGIQALATFNSGASVPSPAYPHMRFAWTDGNVLYARDGANTGWSVDARLAPFAWTSADYVINVRSYGATGDGTSDDTAACQAALTAAANRALFFPPGRYKLMAPLALANAAVRIFGAGIGRSELRFAAGSNGIQITANHGKQFHLIHDLTISTTASAGTALSLDYSGQIIDVGGGQLHTLDRMQPRFLVRDCLICGAGVIDAGNPALNGWVNGILAQAALYGTVRGCTLIGKAVSAHAGAPNSTGLVCVGNPASGAFWNGRPCTVAMLGCRVFAFDRGFYAVNSEGLFVRGSRLTNCRIGAHVLSQMNGHPHFAFSGNVTECQDRGLLIEGQTESIVCRNLLMTNAGGTGAVGVEMGATATSAVLSDNTFQGFGTGAFGAVLRGDFGVISNNVFTGPMVYGIWLAASASGWRGSRNVYPGSFTAFVLNQGINNLVS